MEKPTLFSTPMVQQLPPRGIKTQTRRAIKPQPIADWLSYMTIIEDGIVKALQNGPDYPDGPDDEVRAPYQPGDILWVRETWCKLWALDNNDQIIEGTEKYYYAADGYNPTPFNHFPDENGFSGDRDCPKWRPSIHMPKEAARIFLRLTDVRAERVQDISEADALAEGICERHLNPKAYELNGGRKIYEYDDGSGTTYSAIETYRHLWDSLNAKRDSGKYAWDKNPWVWVYTFEECEKPAGWPPAT